MDDVPFEHDPAIARYASQLARHMARNPEPSAIAAWLAGCCDREGLWTNLRDVRHWIERSRNPA
jgi:hypothetical protein